MFTRIQHVAIAVRGLEAAWAFYRDVLDLTVGRVATLSEQGVRAALLPVGADEIELLEPVDPTGGVARFLERRGEGLHHLCLETPDIATALAEAKVAGLRLIDQTPRPGLAGRVAFLHPEAGAGVLIEMVQPEAEAGHSGEAENAVSLLGFETIFIAVRDLGGAARAYHRNFGAAPAPPGEARRFGARASSLRIGASSVTLLSPDPAGPATPVEPLLADRGGGLFGIGLRVKDLAHSIRYLKDRGVAVEMRQEAGAVVLAGIHPSRACGARLFLMGPGAAPAPLDPH